MGRNGCQAGEGELSESAVGQDFQGIPVVFPIRIVEDHNAVCSQSMERMFYAVYAIPAIDKNDMPFPVQYRTTIIAVIFKGDILQKGISRQGRLDFLEPVSIMLDAVHRPGFFAEPEGTVTTAKLEYIQVLVQTPVQEIDCRIGNPGNRIAMAVY